MGRCMTLTEKKITESRVGKKRGAGSAPTRLAPGEKARGTSAPGITPGKTVATARNRRERSDRPRRKPPRGFLPALVFPSS
jgi:hypothetical protein